MMLMRIFPQAKYASKQADRKEQDKDLPIKLEKEVAELGDMARQLKTDELKKALVDLR